MSLCILSIILTLPFRQVPLLRRKQTRVVTEVEQRFTTALLKKDAVTLDELLAEDLLHIGFEGQFAGKAEYLAFFKRDIWQYRKYEPGNVSTKVLNNVAVVTGRVDRTIVINGEVTTGAFAFTHVWSRAGKDWRMISSQVTTVPNRVS